MSVSLRCYSTSLGCPKNRVDTERLLGSLGVALVPVESPDEAELVFINTCAFIQPATEESVRTIAQAIADIEDLPKRPLLAVAGCLVGRYHAEDLAPELPEVDLWLDNSDLEEWPAMLARKLGLPEPTVPGRILSTGPSYAWLKISDGCRHACSFCAIPNIRGGHRSHCKDMIVREARALLDQGVKELNLVAQDLTEWGCDLDGKQDLRTLLDGLLPLPGLERLRLMYLYPAGMTHEMLKYLREAGKPFVPYFDVPVQHSHPDVLSRMGRPFARNPREAIDRIRNVFPEAALRTSIMVGFPGETEAEFAQTKDTCTRAGFARMHVFPYSEREGTKAALMPDSVPRHIREERARELIALGRELEKKALEARIGREEDVLVEEIDGQGNGAGYTGGYMRVCVEGGKPGEIARVRITGTDGEELTGEIIENEKGEIHMSDCLFCKIAAGEIPSTKVYEDETTLAFRDIAPQAPVHVLVIPKKHVSGWYDAQGESDETLAHLMRVAAQVAKSEGIVESGFRVVSNCGDDAQQTVKHLHLHVLGGKKMDGRMA